MIAVSLEQFEGKFYSESKHARQAKQSNYGLHEYFLDASFRSFEANHNNNDNKNEEFLSDNPDEAKVMIATALALLVGTIQVFDIILRNAHTV